ncbi:MAG: DUF4244 domain-containing protein [Candidatus Phosphoribacter sp.]
MRALSSRGSRRVLPAPVGRWVRWRLGNPRVDDGMTTAEYAVGTLAAVAFAAALIAVVKSEAVRSALTQIIQTALATG